MLSVDGLQKRSKRAGPGLGQLTVRKAVFANDQKFWAIFKDAQMNTFTRRQMIVTISDRNGNPADTWLIGGATVSRIIGTSSQRDDTVVAVDAIEIVFETCALKPRMQVPEPPSLW